MKFPSTENLALIRTSFSNEDGWRALLQTAKNPPAPFKPYFAVIDDQHFDGRTIEEVLAALPEDYSHSAVFIADDKAISDDGFPCLVVGPLGEEVRNFRTLAREIASIDSNLSIGNMGFEEFEDASGPDRVFRGFR